MISPNQHAFPYGDREPTGECRSLAPGGAGPELVPQHRVRATPASMLTPMLFFLPSFCGVVLLDELWSPSRMFLELLAIMSLKNNKLHTVAPRLSLFISKQLVC